MTDRLRFHTLDELRGLSLPELQALWELVPTDRQRRYKQAYDRELKNADAAGSDVLEARIAAELLRRYEEAALVPVGTRWAKTPLRVQQAAREGELLETPDTRETDRAGKPSPKVLVGGGIALFIIVAVFLSGRLRGGSAETPEATDAPTTTPTPLVSPTPTPLALEAQDDVIEEGDNARTLAYPINLQIDTGDGTPRVWVVQRRVIATSEWDYDPNPDTASFLYGMAVRPIIGIPWSEDNAAWFAQMNAGTTFTLQMNTGAVLRYVFVDKTEVRRSDTRQFRQIEPGLVLLLIGETDADGMPTATRTLVTATYPPEQELSRGGQLAEMVSLPTLIPTPTPPATSEVVPDRFAGVQVDVVSVTHIEGQVTTRLRLYNGSAQTLHLTPDDFWIAFGFSPNPPGPRIPAESLVPFDLLPEQAVDLTLVWPWGGEPYASLGIGAYRFALHLTPLR